jgi:hypothetical protein
MKASCVMTPPRGVEAHEPRLSLLDPEELGDRLEPRVVVGLLALDDAPQVPGHAVHLLQHRLRHLGGALGGDHRRCAPPRVVCRGRIDGEFRSDLSTREVLATQFPGPLVMRDLARELSGEPRKSGASAGGSPSGRYVDG